MAFFDGPMTDAHYNAFKEIVREFSAAEQCQLFHDNAARLYRLG